MAMRLFACRAQQAMAIMSNYTNLRSFPFPVPIGAKIVPFMAWVLLSQKTDKSSQKSKKRRISYFAKRLEILFCCKNASNGSKAIKIRPLLAWGNRSGSP